MPAGNGDSGAGLGAAALRDLAERHGIRPAKSLGQNFLTDPNLARRIAALAEVGPDDRVVEVGAGLGSLTVALAATGAQVLAIEFDRALLPPLREVTADLAEVEVLGGDAMAMDWRQALAEAAGDATASWTMVANLPYNIATPLLLDLLAGVPQIRAYLVMVQREVGERLAARPGGEGYGAVSVKVAYRADSEIVRRVPATVFWPRPRVASVLVRLTPRVPPVGVDPVRLFRVVEEGFAERRKTMRNALRRLGLGKVAAGEALRRCGIDPATRAEEIDLAGFALLAEAVGDAAEGEAVEGAGNGPGGGERG